MEKTDLFNNTDGLNLTDSPFYVKDGQATGGYNYEYTKTGAITKVRGLSALNSVANAQTNIQGVIIHDTSDGDKTILCAAGTKLQTFTTSTEVFTNIAEDTTTAGTDFFGAASTQQVVNSTFNSQSANQTWLAGGGLTLPYAYNEGLATTAGVYLWRASADFVSSNVISFTINGTPYSVNFTTNNATTLRNIANTMKTNANITSAGSDGSHTIAVVGVSGTTITFSAQSVTGGASQPTLTVLTVTPASAAPGTAMTKNGSEAPTGTFTAAVLGASGGSWGANTGAYYYALAARKRSSHALSNAALDQPVTTSNNTDAVLLTFPAIDATKYDLWYIYRSSVSGVEGFTAGTLVAKVSTADATFTDTYINLATAQNVPRNGNTILDNSVLPAGTYNYVTAYKRHLVAAQNSTVYFSDLDKPESWPAGATITIPSGGNITGLQIIGYNSPNTGTTDEYLMVFKQRELWVITGTGQYDSTAGIYDYALKFVDSVGCIQQALSVKCNGFVAWVDYRGVYLWDGMGKPVYCSRPVEGLFGFDGDLDKTNLHLGFGVFFRKKNQIIWTLSHRVKGVNKIQLKMDLRLTVPKLSQNFSGNNVLEGVFMLDSFSSALYAGVTYLPPGNNDEKFIVGDHSGFLYQAYYTTNDKAGAVNFTYLTKAFDMGLPSVAKQFEKIVVYIDQSVAKNLSLKYWSGYKALAGKQGEIDRSMDTGIKISASVWDNSYWNIANWDEYSTQIVPLVYNLNSSGNNNQGDSIQFQLSQTDTDAPVTIYGFSVFWDALSVRK